MADDHDQESCSLNHNEVYITLVAVSTLKRKAKRARVGPFCRALFTDKNYCEAWVKKVLPSMVHIPQAYLNGHDTDMFDKLSRMIRSSVLQNHGVAKGYVFVLIVVFRTICCYNVVNSPWFFQGVQLPSCEYLQSLARKGEYSFPSGIAALSNFKIEDHRRENTCARCLQGFNTGSDAAMLPCSHVYHCMCIVEWFVKSGTCPLCRFPCIDDTFSP